MTRFTLTCWALFTASLLVLKAGPTAAQHRFELADLGKLVNVTNPQLAPDSQSILITVSPDGTQVAFLARYRAQSPLARAGLWRTPTLILHNVNDFRVPIANAYKFYHTLQDRGVPVRFVAFPIAAHIPSDPVRSAEWNRLWLAWLDHYLQPNADSTATPTK